MVRQNTYAKKCNDNLGNNLTTIFLLYFLGQNLEFSNTPGGSLNSKKQVAVLVLSRLRPDDEGIYKCRADFKRSPTKNNRMYLDVLSKYSILDLGTTYKCIYLSVLEREIHEIESHS